MREIINDVVVNEPPSIAGSDDNNILILGGAKCVWEDYFEACKLMPSHKIMCVNDIGGQFKAEPIHHMVSLHKGFFTATKLLRKEKSMLEKYYGHCSVQARDADYIWDMENVGGTSGVFATKVALAIGAKKIILCGIPMDNSGHYFDPPDASDNRTTKFGEQRGTLQPIREMKQFSQCVQQRVRSMSGNTAKIFGQPTQDWLR